MIDFIRIQHIQSGLKFKRFRFRLINSIKSVTQFKCRKENEQKCWTIWPFFLSLSPFAHFLASEINQHYGKNDFGFLCTIEFLLAKTCVSFCKAVHIICSVLAMFLLCFSIEFSLQWITSRMWLQIFCFFNGSFHSFRLF